MLKIIFIFNKILSKIYNFYADRDAKVGTFLSQQESIELLIKTKKSLIRWGDGESIILTGGDLYFQKNTVSLFKSFHEIIKKYNKNSDFLIAMPNDFLLATKEYLKKDYKYNLWKYTRYIYEFYFKKQNVLYLDSFIFRENSKLTNNLIEKLWETEKVIFFIHNNYKYFIDFQNKYKKNKKIIFFQITSANSFNQMNSTIKKINQKQQDLNITKENICILLSAGPAGKAYVLLLTKQGYRTIDMGHYFDYKFYDIRRNDK